MCGGERGGRGGDDGLMGANQDAAAVSPSTSFFLLQRKWPCCNVAMLAERRKRENSCIVAEMDKKLIYGILYIFIQITIRHTSPLLLG